MQIYKLEMVHIATEYALGSMTQLVRNRFERLMEEDADLNKLVCQWEQHLQPLSNNSF